MDYFPTPGSHMSGEATGEENNLYQHTFKGNWEEVVHLYETTEVGSSAITSSKDTALHMAISDDREDIVKKLVRIIETKNSTEALQFKNERGETPMHRAAARGSARMCECIVKAGVGMHVNLLAITNRWGETPIFTAALHDRKHAFISLHNAAIDPRSLVVDPYQLLRRTVDGDTVLHSTIKREHFDLAFHIIQLYPDLLEKFNEKGMTPLHVLASKPSAFRSSSHLSWWKKIIYCCILVDPLKFDRNPSAPRTSEQTSSNHKCPKNYLTCYQFFSSWYPVLGKVSEAKGEPAKSSARKGKDEEKGGDAENPNSSHITNKNIPQNYTTCYEFLSTVFLNFSGVIGFGKTFTEIKKARQKHTWSVQILDELMKKPSKAYMKDGSNPGSDFIVSDHDDLPERPFDVKKAQNPKGDRDKDNKTQREEKGTDTALLVAAQKGVIEVVNKILSQLPVSIHDTSSKNKNILMVAVENRQPRIFEALHKHLTEESNKPNLWDDLIQSVDTDDHTILHLAAMYDESLSHPWQIHGSAMQMQWEIKWYEYVKSFPPPHFIFLTNKQEETPGQIFTRDHKELVKCSGEWLKDTSESCSVVAALVAGVSFATSSSVPGGTDDQTGRPTLEGQPAFELFAITALIGLCFSVTALIMFLSILTSRKQPTDFKRNLPLKLLLGLSSLFVSIASMLISFCAAHFFVLEDKFKKAVFPLYAATCLPVSFYAIAQFPLYVDLLKAIVTRVPHSHHVGHL